MESSYLELWNRHTWIMESPYPEYGISYLDYGIAIPGLWNRQPERSLETLHKTKSFYKSCPSSSQS
jgi:hypothetical protein